MHPKGAHRVTSSVDPDQIERGLHCLPRPLKIIALFYFIQIKGNFLQFGWHFPQDAC